jgi:hypothetical protein
MLRQRDEVLAARGQRHAGCGSNGLDGAKRLAVRELQQPTKRLRGGANLSHGGAGELEPVAAAKRVDKVSLFADGLPVAVRAVCATMHGTIPLRRSPLICRLGARRFLWRLGKSVRFRRVGAASRLDIGRQIREAVSHRTPDFAERRAVAPQSPASKSLGFQAAQDCRGFTLVNEPISFV